MTKELKLLTELAEAADMVCYLSATGQSTRRALAKLQKITDKAVAYLEEQPA